MADRTPSCDDADRDAARRGGILRLAGLAAIALTIANCAGPQFAGKPGDSEAKYGVKASPRVVADGDPIPKGGGRAMVGKPYVIAGRTYVPTAAHYRKEGWASWYGTDFHGRLTANGEIFDRESVAAAHPTLPLPSYVRVTNVLNKRSMIVRVNDRGPFERNRILDVSERVAEALDFRRKGTARVRIDYVGKASVKGSDDETLLATLTTDGTPAPFGGNRTMVADLREQPSPRAPVVGVGGTPPSSRPSVVAVVDAAPAAAADVPEMSPAVEPPVVVASSTPDAESESEVDHPMPPPRPSFGKVRVASVVQATVTALVSQVPPRAEPLPPQRPELDEME